MSRRLRPLVLLLGLATIPAFAAESLADAVGCPASKAAEEAESAADDDRAHAGSAAVPTAQRAAGGEAAGAPQRMRPRWQSFLPGMIR